MKSKLLTINQAAEMVGVSISTLRRWDKSGKLPAVRKKQGGYRYYHKNDIELYLQDIFAVARDWIFKAPTEPLSNFYCQTSLVFKARLAKLETLLSRMHEFSEIFPFLIASTGEIGNNSFDHNLGNWPDIPGVFFAYDLDKKTIVLADRGVGILQTLKRVRPELPNDKEALLTAFTEVVSGRAPESRGNGLKFVKNAITNNALHLFFQTGNAQLFLKKDDTEPTIQESNLYLRGCLARITF